MRRGAKTLRGVGNSLREAARQLLVGSSGGLPESHTRGAEGLVDEAYGYFSELTRGQELREVRFTNGAATMTFTDGRCYHWDPSQPAARMYTVPLVGTFEAKETGFVRRAIRPGFVCFDVGASFGWYTVLLSRLCGLEGSVHAFEPVPATFGLLQRNLDLNAIRNVAANQTALDATSGRKEMYIPDIGVSGSFALHPFESSYRSLSVETQTLDDYVEARGLERLDFLKADIEGAELGLLQGGARTLERFGPLLMLEVQRKSTALFGYEPAEVFRRLAGYGYTACYVNSEGALVEAGDCHGELPDYNFVFRR